MDICQQLGWKVPPMYSDTGNAVYRRSDAIVLNPEYNGSFISWLQLQYEGKISRRHGYDWSTAVEIARLRWTQMEEKESARREDVSKIKDLLQATIKLNLQSIEQQKLNFKTLMDEVKDNKEKVERLTAKIDDKINSTVSQLADALVQTLKSAKDVDQRVLARFKKVKLKSK